VSAMQTFARPRLTRRQGAELLSRIAAASRAAGLTRPAPAESVTRLCLNAACIALCLGAAWFSSSPVLVAAAWLGLAWCVAQMAFLAHGALHGAVGASRSANLIFGQLAMTVFAGLGFEEWKQRHREHHIYCQIDGRDPDMAVDFVASLTADAAASKGAAARALGRYQGVYLWGLSLLFGHSQRTLSQLGALAAPRRYRRDLALLAIHYGVWIVLPLLALNVPVERVLAAYLVPATLLGAHFAAIFWVNHVGMPLIGEPKAFSYVERQVVTTRNVCVPAPLDAVFGGLNYQIEHHLVPSCPPFRLRRLRAVLRPLLIEAGLPYHETGWWHALREVGTHFRRIGALMARPAG